MAEDRWGPFPALARQLASSAPDLVKQIEFLPADERNSATWAHVTGEYGGLWGLYVSQFLPEVLRFPAEKREARVGFWARLIASLRQIFGETVQHSASADEIAETLVRCHAWLGQEILKGADPWFAPLWRDVPVDLLHVSQTAIGWALYGYVLDRDGSVRDETLSFLDEATMLNLGSLPGDLIAVHLICERVAVRAGEIFVPGAREAEVERLRGGIRSQSFLKFYPFLWASAEGHIVDYPSLNPNKHTQISSDWLRAYRHLVMASPITQLAYLDVIEPRGFLDITDPMTSAPASTPPTRPIEVTNDAPTRPYSEMAAWGSMWQAQLVRAILGAMLSPAAGHELDGLAEASIKRLERAVPDRAGKNAAALSRARALKERAQTIMNLSRQTRVIDLHGALGLVVGGPEVRIVQLRLLDMLVRTAVATATQAMRDQWTETNVRSAQRPVNVVFGQNGAGTKAVHHALFGNTPLPELAQPAHIEVYERLLLPGADEALASEPLTAVWPEDLRAVVARFSDQGVDLPRFADKGMVAGSSDDDRGPAPAHILETIFLSIINAQQVQTDVTAVG